MSLEIILLIKFITILLDTIYIKNILYNRKFLKNYYINILWQKGKNKGEDEE